MIPGIVATIVFVVASITEMLLEHKSVTSTRLPFWLTATPKLQTPATPTIGILVTTASVAVSITMTVVASFVI